MKVLSATALLAVLCSACASTSGNGSNSGLPNGYTAVIKADSAVISRSDGATINYFQSKEDGISAIEAISLVSGSCEGSAQGDASKASVKNCKMDNQNVDVYVYSSGGLVKLISSNEKVSYSDVQFVADHFIIKE